MQFLVICRRVPDGDTDAFARLVADEGAVLRKLQANGILTEAWSPGGPGAVLMLDLPDQAAAERITERAPARRGRPHHHRGDPAAPAELLTRTLNA